MRALLFFVSSMLCAWKILRLLTLHGDVQLLTRYSHGCNGLLPLTSIYEKESCMNYTENCHLPQWEEEDRVLRTDFNNAFAALEVIGADHARVRAVEDALIRDAYRREVRGHVCHGPYGALDGMWVNALTTREDAGGDGHGWNGKYGVSLGGGYLPTVEGIKESKKEISEISTIGEAANRNYQAAAEFVSNGYGTMTALSCYFNRWYNSKENLTITIRLLRLDTNQQVAEAGPLTSGPDLYTTFPVNFPMEANIPYRLEFDYPEDAQFTGLCVGALYRRHLDDLCTQAGGGDHHPENQRPGGHEGSDCPPSLERRRRRVAGVQQDKAGAGEKQGNSKRLRGSLHGNGISD